jgi:hypothetical protein
MEEEPRTIYSTPGPWVVTQTKVKGYHDHKPCICVATINDEIPAKVTRIVAITGIIGEADEDTAIANASLISVIPVAIEALIDIQTELNTSKEVIDLEKINDIISAVFEKIAAESGEQS